MKRYFGIHILGLLFFTFSPTAQSANGAAAEPKRGGTVTLGITRDISVMNPLVDTGSTQKRIRDLMFEPLLGIDLKGYLQPGLAEAWEVSKDGKLYTIRLRKGVKFHNGQEMTAEDAKFSIDYSMNLLARSPFGAPRQIIDVSGDGTNNSGRDVTLARDAAIERGVIINGLVILSEIPLPTNPMHTHPPGGLTAYYENNVIGGPGAFVLEAQNFESFGQMLIQKLIKEIAGLPRPPPG